MASYLTPVVTPLKNGKIDFESCEKLYNHLINGGVDGILLFGSIGEFFSFTLEEKKELIKFAHKIINDQVELIIGTTSLIYKEIVELSNYCFSIGIKSVIIIPPYYFWFKDKEIYNYYYRLSKELKGNFYLYNFPDRMGYSIELKTIMNLVKDCPNLIGIKDTVNGIETTKEIIEEIKKINPNFKVYSGFDDNFSKNVSCGGDGCIAGLSNIYPELASSIVKAYKSNDLKKVEALQNKINNLMKIYDVGTPFVPFIKEALKIKGIISSSESMFPMPEVELEKTKMIKSILEGYENEKN